MKQVIYLIFILNIFTVPCEGLSATKKYFFLNNLAGVNVGSKVSAHTTGQLEKEGNGNIIIEIEGFNKTESLTYSIMDVTFGKAIILCAVPDDSIEVSYNDIKFEFYNKSKWHTFINRQKKDSSSWMKISSYIVGLLPFLDRKSVV